MNRRLASLRAQHLDRHCPLPRNRVGVTYELEGRRVVGFCSNDYLGLAARHSTERIHSASGATASRLICGDSPEQRALERALAAVTGSEDAVLFSSGFTLNVGVLPALIERHDRVYSDALNHASIIDGLRLAPARARILAHGSAPPNEPSDAEDPHGSRWWVSEAIYSMDGDSCPMGHAQTFLDRGGLLYLDEAHSFGLFSGGAGLARAKGVRPTVLIGTLGKAFGCSGAFVGTSRAIATWLRARARSFVFSTGISPLVVAALHDALRIVTGPEGDRRRARLWAHIARVSATLDTDNLRSPIFPIQIGDNIRALQVSRALLERGWHVQAIRPPTVPAGTARLRVTLSADHTAEQVDGLLYDLREVLAIHDRPLKLYRPNSHKQAS